MEKQVSKDHYGFFRYSHPDRWVSYFHQIKEIITANPRSVLEVGVGDGVLRAYLKTNTSISYTSLDIAEDLKPDKVGSVTEIPFPDKFFDVCCAFEVLEHIPFDSFDSALQELFRVSRGVVILSLPHFGPPFQVSLKVPLFPQVRFSVKIPFPKKHSFNGEHYWEIGKWGYSLRRVRNVLKKYGTIVRDFVPFENQYHHFFVIEKK